MLPTEINRRLIGLFHELCQQLVWTESSSVVDHVGASNPILPRLDGFASEVAQVEPFCAELASRLQDASPELASIVLAEYGFFTERPLTLGRLARVRDAATRSRQESRSLLIAWPISSSDERQMLSEEVVAAIKTLLLELDH